MPTLTGSIADILGTQFDHKRTAITVTSNAAQIGYFDGAGELHLGGARVAENGTFSITLPSTAGIDGLAYFVSIDYPDPAAAKGRGTWTSGWFALTADAALRDVADIATPNAPAIAMVGTAVSEATIAAATATQASTDAADSATAAAASAATARDISQIDVSDDVIDASLKLEGSKSRTTLDAAFAPGGTAGNIGATDLKTKVAAQPGHIDPAFAAFRSALDGGRSTGMWSSGDSTDDDDGDWINNPRTTSQFAKLVAAAYPSHHVQIINLDAATNQWAIPIVAQAASGHRYMGCGGRSVRYYPEAWFASNTIDVALKIAPNDWTPASKQALWSVNRTGAPGAAVSNYLFAEFWLNTDGTLGFRFSTDQTSWGSGDKASTAAVNGFADGAFGWVRVLHTWTPGTGTTTKFYTSPDGWNWTQLGSDVTTAWTGQPTLPTPGADVFMEIGAAGWQPTYFPFAGKIERVFIRDGQDGPFIAPVLPELWQQYVGTETSWGGSPVVTFTNASVAGSKMDRHTTYVADQIARETPNYGQVVARFNDGHNEVENSGRRAWVAPYKAWVQAVQARVNVAPLVVIQNPHTSAWANEATAGKSQLVRMDELRALAAANGWTVDDTYQAFLADPRGVSSLTLADGLHPNADGYAVAAANLARLAGLA